MFALILDWQDLNPGRIRFTFAAAMASRSYSTRARLVDSTPVGAAILYNKFVMADQEDVRRIALSLPGAREASDRFAFTVANQGKEKGFAWAARAANARVAREIGT